MAEGRSGELSSTGVVSSRMYERFEGRHYELVRRTWSGYVARGEGKALTEAQLRQVYEANPAGPSVLTVIEERGEWIGAVSAIPAILVQPGGVRATAYQVGDLVVAPEQQRRGLGNRLVRDLTRFLKELAAPAFTFPNARSLGVFNKQAYVELRRIPTVVYPLLPAACWSWLRFGGRARTRDVSVDEACRVADGLMAAPLTRGHIEKSGAYLRWRYAQTRDAGDYHFTLVERRDAGAPSLVVWSLYRYRGILFQVVVDSIAADGVAPAWCPAAVRGAGRGALMALNHVESGPGWRLPPLAVRLPQRLNPRPVPVHVPPDDPVAAQLMSACLFTTGDWLGF